MEKSRFTETPITAILKEDDTGMSVSMAIVRAIALSLALLSAVTAAGFEGRPEKWAEPVVLDGVPNLHKIDDSLYRSAQPTAAGMVKLKKMGIKTIVSLRSFHSDRDEIWNTGLEYEHIYMKAWHPEVEDVVRFLRLVSDPEHTPVLVHCQHGADRTGTMSAIYRVAVQGWSKEEAVREMVQGGFNFHEIWINLPPWIQKLDIEKIREEAGLSPGDGS